MKRGYGTGLLGETHYYQSREFSVRAQVLPAFEIIRSASTINAELLNRSGASGARRQAS